MALVSAHCDECGGVSAHPVEYIAAAADLMLEPLIALPKRLTKPSAASAHNVAHTSIKTKAFIAFAKLAEKLGVGAFLYAPDQKTLLLDTVLWQEAIRRGITMREFRFAGAVTNTFVATLPDYRTIDFDGVPLAADQKAVWWINNKPLLKKKMAMLGMPVPNGGSVYRLASAQKMFAGLRKPVIVKPAVGSASRHTTMHIRTLAQLTKAFRSAKKISPAVLIEEELVGAVYRPTVVAGRLIATLRRDQPYITGDGTHTVAALVAEENTRLERNGPYFSKIKMDAAAEAELDRQNHTAFSIPTKGERVQLHPKINWGVGGTTTDVTDVVHQDNTKLFEKVAKILDAKLVGIDFIIADITKSWKVQEKCGIIECNDMPYFDNHHLPFNGKPQNVAGAVWDLALK